MRAIPRGEASLPDPLGRPLAHPRSQKTRVRPPSSGSELEYVMVAPEPHTRFERYLVPKSEKDGRWRLLDVRRPITGVALEGIGPWMARGPGGMGLRG
jgi:hypothetical protein